MKFVTVHTREESPIANHLVPEHVESVRDWVDGGCRITMISGDEYIVKQPSALVMSMVDDAHHANLVEAARVAETARRSA